MSTERPDPDQPPEPEAPQREDAEENDPALVPPDFDPGEDEYPADPSA